MGGGLLSTTACSVDSVADAKDCLEVILGGLCATLPHADKTSRVLARGPLSLSKLLQADTICGEQPLGEQLLLSLKEERDSSTQE